MSITTDFGAAYTGICAGVVARIAPHAQVQVLSDEVSKYAIVEGAALLVQALPYLPVGVHVAIVDPGVGTPRHPIVIRTGRGDLLVGPDNGLLVPAAEVLGGIAEARVLSDPGLRLPATSSTFHGRDIFSPAAGHLANGVAPRAFGEEVVPLPLDLPEPVAGDGEVTATVLYADDFGSLILGAHPADLGDGTRFEVLGVPLPLAPTFGAVPVGDPLLFTDSSGRLALGINQGNASDRFGLRAGQTVTVRIV
ncbi:SAM-dependent chlorinase/fluorinase [Actinocorallia longicatena]|uniref:SAM hydrolase/SAM-dependent halogenase family protein n=1 Tax=Actinocorallia longicatena TaxID=111803 RepID=UPI0031E3C364